jgi:hypothetical protein
VTSSVAEIDAAPAEGKAAATFEIEGMNALNGRLDTRHMMGIGLTPVPCPATPRPQLKVLAVTDTLDQHTTPGYVGNQERPFWALSTGAI